MSDWGHFFGSLRKYLEYLRASAHQGVPSVQGFIPGPRQISDDELYGVLSWTRLAAQVCKHVRDFFV
jgi:hypothetical protein